MFQSPLTGSNTNRNCKKNPQHYCTYIWNGLTKVKFQINCKSSKGMGIVLRLYIVFKKLVFLNGLLPFINVVMIIFFYTHQDSTEVHYRVLEPVDKSSQVLVNSVSISLVLKSMQFACLSLLVLISIYFLLNLPHYSTFSTIYVKEIASLEKLTPPLDPFSSRLTLALLPNLNYLVNLYNSSFSSRIVLVGLTNAASRPLKET